MKKKSAKRSLISFSRTKTLKKTGHSQKTLSSSLQNQGGTALQGQDDLQSHAKLIRAKFASMTLSMKTVL